MCGIAGIYLKNPSKEYITVKEADDLVDWLLCGIEHRGTHASGMAIQYPDGKTTLEKSDMEASKFIFWRSDVEALPRTILLHTRLATQGKPENLLNNHPVQYKNIMMTHNGHIGNDDELFKEEEIERIAEVDSEIIPALLQKYTFDNPTEALEKLSGGFAIAAIDELNPGALLLGKGSSSPLCYLETDNMWIWASEKKVVTDALMGALNFEAKESDLKELAYGRYIMINGEESSLEEFKPYVKAYAYNGGTSTWHRDGSDGWSNNYGMGRDQCDECFVWYPIAKLTKLPLKDGKNTPEMICEYCDKKLHDRDEKGNRVPKNEQKLSKKERKRLRKAKARRFREGKSGKTTTIVIPKKPTTLGDALENEHWAVCQLVADFYSTKPEFVDFMLNGEEEIEDYDDPNLVTMFVEFEEKYKELLEEVRGETDALIEAMSHDTRFPVGFGGI